MEEGNVEKYQVGIDLYVFSSFLLASLFQFPFRLFPTMPFPLNPMSISTILFPCIPVSKSLPFPLFPFLSSLPSLLTLYLAGFLMRWVIADISPGEQD